MQKSQHGYTLIEIGFVLSIAALILAFTLPTTVRWISNAREDGTREEMKGIVESATRFFRDTGMLPPTLGALQSNDPPISGWNGPYHGVDPNLRGNSGEEALQDAWGNPYIFSVVNSYNGTVRSVGPDGIADTSPGEGNDDLLLFFNVHDVAREVTRDRLDVLNRALATYNESLLEIQGPLPTNLNDVITQLQFSGLIPAGGGPYDVDGWNQPFVLGPPPAQSMSSLGSPDPGPVLTLGEEEVAEEEEQEGGNGKITICHIPPGNPNNAHNIKIPQAALAAHQAHGDTVGPCPHGE